MKAGDAAYFCALRTLIAAGARLKGDVILTYVVGELQGGVGTLALMQSGCAPTTSSMPSRPTSRR